MVDVATCPLDELEPVPWKNGKGTTRELLILPEDATLGGSFDVRLSIARIERDAEFSTLEGVERIFTPLAGEPFALVHERFRDPIPQRIGEPYRFDGSWKTRAVDVTTPVDVLNVMLGSPRATATVECLRASGRPRRFPLDTDHAILVVYRGHARVRVSGEETPLNLTCTALWLSPESPAEEWILDTLTPNAQALLIAIRRHPPTPRLGED